jgi:hypothetical protein
VRSDAYTCGMRGGINLCVSLSLSLSLSVCVCVCVCLSVCLSLFVLDWLKCLLTVLYL